MLTVLIPIGPKPIYTELLPRAIESVLNQTRLPDEILIVADGEPINRQLFVDLGFIHSAEDYGNKVSFYSNEKGIKLNIWCSPWNIGFSQAFNCGVGLADNDLILYLAADDMLAPTAVEDCIQTWEENNHKDAWYALTHESLTTGEQGNIPNNAAMITRNLWKWLGGYPPSAFAGPDAILLSILMVHASDRIIKVAEGKINYYYQEHADQETKRQFSFYVASGIMDVIRNKETERFVPNKEIQLT